MRIPQDRSKLLCFRLPNATVCLNTPRGHILKLGTLTVGLLEMIFILRWQLGSLLLLYLLELLLTVVATGSHLFLLLTNAFEAMNYLRLVLLLLLLHRYI